MGRRFREVTRADETYGRTQCCQGQRHSFVSCPERRASTAAGWACVRFRRQGLEAAFGPKLASIGWWHHFVAPGKASDTSRFFVVCANYLGGCYGSTGPSSIDPSTGRNLTDPGFHRLPCVTVWILRQGCWTRLALIAFTLVSGWVHGRHECAWPLVARYPKSGCMS